MITVLHSELQGDIGGIESFLLNLSRCVNQKEVHFDFLIKGENKKLEQRLLKLGCNVYKVPDNNLIKYVLFICRILKKNNYNYVHIHKNSAINIVLPILTKFLSNAKIIIHSHNTDPSNSPIFLKILHYINRPILNYIADYRFACSNEAQNWLFGRKKLVDVTIVHNGIILDDYIFNIIERAKIRKELGLANKTVLGNVGGFRKQKNQIFMINILKLINDNSVVLLLVGTGKDLPIVEDYVKKSKLANNVFFFKERSDVNNILSAMDIFLMPSLWEGLPVASVEAQASGLPLLLSDNISKEVKLTNKVYFLSLDNLKRWVEKIHYLSKKKREDADINKIIEAGYDMKNTGLKITEFYKKNK